jgi:hypothetical protein
MDASITFPSTNIFTLRQDRRFYLVDKLHILPQKAACLLFKRIQLDIRERFY